MQPPIRTDTRSRAAFRAARFAWLALPMLVAAMAGIWVADVRVAWHHPLLFGCLTYAMAVLAVAFICLPAGRHFLATGQGSVLMLGGGVWLLSLAVMGGAAGAVRGLDTNWAIYNSGVLLSALCHFAGLAFPSGARARRPGIWLAATFGGGLALLGGIAWAAFADRMPAFYRPGQGGTLLHALVIILAASLFAWTAALLGQAHRRAADPFLNWYALGLALIAIGLAGSLLTVLADSPLQWATRTARAH